MITQEELGKALGLDRTTVGGILNNKATLRVRPETRRSVLEAAQRLGYHPHRYAQIMRKGKTGMIGVIQALPGVQTSLERSFHAAKAIHESQYQLLTSDVMWHKDGLRHAVNGMLEARVEGLLLIGLDPDFTTAEIKRIQNAKIPTVVLGGCHIPSFAYVNSNFRQGMIDLTRHLLNLGHRRLTLLAWAERPDRVEGFRTAAAQAGLSEEEAAVICPPIDQGFSDLYRPGKLGMEQILRSRERPEVVLCSNDYWAIGALKACAEAGVRVPEDIALTGFDNIAAGEYTTPSLTSVIQPTEATSKKAVELLLGKIGKKDGMADEDFIQLPCQLVVRQSCGTAKQVNRRPESKPNPGNSPVERMANFPL